MSENLVTNNKIQESDKDLCKRIEEIEKSVSNGLDRSKCPFSNCKNLTDIMVEIYMNY